MPKYANRRGNTTIKKAGILLSGLFVLLKEFDYLPHANFYLE